jgi:hypothetical protein
LITEKKVEKGISNIVGALTDPIIVFPGGWGDSLPDWLKNAISMERLIMNIKDTRGEEPTGTDAEACAYLMTVSLTQPINSDWTQIYLYVAGQTCRSWNKSEIPDDIRVESLTDQQTADLSRLKEWLYRQRTTARQNAERVEMRQRKEAEVARRKEGQSALFVF